MRRAASGAFAALALGLALGTAGPVRAQDWSPFNDGTETIRPPRRTAPLPPAGPVDDRPPALPNAPPAPLTVTIEQGTLPPIEAGPDAVPGPAGVAPVIGPAPTGRWRGVDLRAAQDLFAGLELPARSPALAGAYQAMVTAGGGTGASELDAIRSEALLKAGLVRDALQAVAQAEPGSAPLAAALRARLDVAAGDTARGCRTAQQLIVARADLPRPLKGDLLVLAGYCAAKAGNPAAAGLTASLARDDGFDSWPVAALDAIAAGDKPRLAGATRIGPVDYRLYELGGGDDMVGLLEKLEPASLALLADATTGDARLRVAAFEAAARLNVIPPQRLAELWRAQVFSADELAGPAAQVSPLLRRALLFRSADQERNPARKARALRALLDDTRRGGLYFASLAAVSGAVRQLEPVSEIGWFAETAVEVLLASGQHEAARRWARLGSGADRAPGQTLDHWQALIDIADPALRQARGQSLASVEALALRGRYPPALLHRLATVLDALDTNVPIPLWEAASRTPQPTAGYLPPTGVLADLAAAAKANDDLRTVLLAIKALGTASPETVNILVLGDIIRALRRVGLEADARQVGLEALIGEWPRATGS